MFSATFLFVVCSEYLNLFSRTNGIILRQGSSPASCTAVVCPRFEHITEVVCMNECTLCTTDPEALLPGSMHVRCVGYGFRGHSGAGVVKNPDIHSRQLALATPDCILSDSSGSARSVVPETCYPELVLLIAVETKTGRASTKFLPRRPRNKTSLALIVQAYLISALLC